MGSQPAMTPEERQEIRRYHSGCTDGCLVPALLADYDHLVEVARERADRWETAADLIGRRALIGDPAPVMAQMQTLRSCAAALRALIDPATPEPVEGEPHA